MRSILNIRRLVDALRYSYAGLSDGVRLHTSFRQELVVGAVLAPLAVWLGDDGLQRAVMLSSLVLVLIVELLNSAVETVVDRIGTEESELSGRAKDLGSAAVFLSLLNVPLVWGLVLLG
jgi:diacylglycerol kinase (ATP)